MVYVHPVQKTEVDAEEVVCVLLPGFRAGFKGDLGRSSTHVEETVGARMASRPLARQPVGVEAVHEVIYRDPAVDTLLLPGDDPDLVVAVVDAEGSRLSNVPAGRGEEVGALERGEKTHPSCSEEVDWSGGELGGWYDGLCTLKEWGEVLWDPFRVICEGGYAWRVCGWVGKWVGWRSVRAG